MMTRIKFWDKPASRRWIWDLWVRVGGLSWPVVSPPVVPDNRKDGD